MIGWIIAGILGAMLLIGGCVAGSWAYRYYTAPIEGRVGAQEQIQSAPSRIVNYNHFFDLCAAIQGHEGNIDAAQGQLGQGLRDDERERVIQTIAGLKGQRVRSIAQYNADARKNYTAGQFRDSDLPYQLAANDYPLGGKTSCGAS